MIEPPYLTSPEQIGAAILEAEQPEAQPEELTEPRWQTLDDPYPFVSVVVPLYNASRTLRRCLGSLQKQTLPPEQWEIILVDNGSTDETPSVCRQFARVVPNTQLIVEKKRGPAAARNAGVKRARGEIVAFTDSDCYCRPDWLAELRDVFCRSGNSVALVGGNIKTYAPRYPLYSYYEKRRILNQYKFYREPQEGFLPFFATANAAVRRKAFLEIGGFDLDLFPSEDADLSWRLQLAGWQLQYAAGAVVFHHFPSRPGDLFKTGRKYGIGVRQLLKKYPERFTPATRLEIERWLWLIKAIVKTPIAPVINPRDVYKRLEPRLDVLSNAGYLWGKWAGSDFRF